MHGGGGRYDAILEFKGEQIKNQKNERKNEKYIYVRKRKNI
jgi:hypothetical protein